MAGGCFQFRLAVLSGPLSKALGRKFRREKEDKPDGEENDPKL